MVSGNRAQAQSPEYKDQLNELNNNSAWLWLQRQAGFQKALQQLKKRDDNFNYYKTIEWPKFRFAGDIAEIFADYYDMCEGKLSQLIVTKKQKKIYLEAISDFNAHIRSGLHFRDLSKTHQLLALLEELATEVNAPSLTPTKKSKDPAKQILIQQLARLFMAAYGSHDDYCTGMITEVASVVLPEAIGKDEVQSILRPMRDLYKEWRANSEGGGTK